MRGSKGAALADTVRMSACAMVVTAAGVLSCVSVAVAQPVSIHNEAVTASFSEDGTYRLQWHPTHWTLEGQLAKVPSNVVRESGSGRLGAWRELAARTSVGVAVIRVYENVPVVLFRMKYTKSVQNKGSFPRFRALPKDAMKFSYRVNAFAPYEFGHLGTEGPWVLFNRHRQTMVLSPADHFLVAAMSTGRSAVDPGGISRKIHTLPAGLGHGTLLVFGKGIVDTLDAWGRALQALNGKKPVSNHADVMLRKFGYWTDHGATYYYHFLRKLGYEGTLLAVRRAYQKRGVPIGYMQLDSWWYPKQKGNSLAAMAVNGETVYRANPKIFRHGLRAFHEEMGIPFAVHARWVAPDSPYRGEYRMSRNVILSAAFWKTTARYLHRSGVVVYEQDWLNKNARPAVNLTAGQEFLGNMAHAMAHQGIAIQYCMALPAYFLASTRYQNVETIRVSGDHFVRARWNQFLYSSVLAHAVGLWPWSDVFMSTHLPDLILSTLSGGPVGVGDPVNQIDTANLRRAMRADSVLLKPDVPIRPLDESFLAAAQHRAVPMVAATHSGDEVEVFAYPRRKVQRHVTIPLRELGISGPAYAWDWVDRRGRLIAAGGRVRMVFHGGWGYTIVAPVDRHGIALLGDTSQIVPLAKQRFTATHDGSHLRVAVTFAREERRVTVSGYAAKRPRLSVSDGTIRSPHYSPATHLFRVIVHPEPGRQASRTAVLSISAG